MNRLITPILGLLLSLASSHATVSFYAIKDAYDVNSANPQLYRYDGISNFRSGVQASITTRNAFHGVISDIAIDEQGAFYVVGGDPVSATSRQIYKFANIAAWASNNGSLLGTRTTTFQISGFSVYKNEFYFMEGDPNSSGNKTLRKWASAADWAGGSAGNTLGTRNTGAGLGFEIDAGGAVWYLDGSTQAGTSGILWRWNSINNFLTDTGVTNNGGTFNFSFSGTSDQVAGLAVPEPSSSLLLLTSLVTLSLFRRLSS